MARAQASTEFIVILGVSLVILLVFFTLALDFLFSVRSQRDYNDALSAVETLAAEADAVHSQGAGAEKMVQITLPPSTVFSPNVTYIGRPLNSVAGKSNTISISLGGAVLTATTTANIVGTFPTYAGTHQMRVTSYGNFVGIGTHLISASPDAVFASTARSATKSVSLSFLAELTESTNDSVRVSLSSPWNYTNANLSISPSSFSTFGIASVPVSLTFSTNGNAVGIYTSSLNVTAVRQASDGSMSARETFSVPLTLEVSSG
ncbi:MAG: hypothetical protein WC861_06450 [Candidatus Micrarchaeia archaeon]|jgi:uncharacterized protein (UPF0333 family)